MKKHRIIAITILFITFFFHTAKNVSAVELITNGGFETAGTLVGWTAVNSPSPWRVWANSTAGQGGGFLSVAPTSVVQGTRNAWQGMTDNVTANSQWQLYQNVTVPAGNNITVSWRDRYQINHTEFCPGGTCQPKFYFVEITNSTGTTVIQTLHTQSTIGNVNQDTGWVSRSVNVTGVAGQTVRLRFRGTETTPLSGPGQIEIDAVSVNSIPTTAASVSVGGRVSTANGSGIRNAVVTLTDLQGNARTTVTGSFGYYRFDEVSSGEVYVLSVASKRFNFNQPSQILTVNQDAANIDFVAIE